MSLVNKILREAERDLGKPLSSKTSNPFVVIYRACHNSVTEFLDRDYVTLSKRFAIEHAENNHIYHEEPYHVIQAVVSANNVFDAPNVDEYFYSGPNKKGKVIYTSKGEDYEGLNESALNEIFGGKTYDYEWVHQDSDHPLFVFNDDNGNTVEVLTSIFPVCQGEYMGAHVEFSVNGKYSVGHSKASASSYIKILNTVVVIVRDLIETIGLDQIAFTAEKEKSSADSSKRGRIYTAIANAMKGDFVVETHNDGRQDYIILKSPALIQTEKEFAEQEETIEEVSTPTVTTIEPLTHDYYSPKEKEQKRKKAEREKGYREEGRYEGLY